MPWESKDTGVVSQCTITGNEFVIDHQMRCACKVSTDNGNGCLTRGVCSDDDSHTLKTWHWHSVLAQNSGSGQLPCK